MQTHFDLSIVLCLRSLDSIIALYWRQQAFMAIDNPHVSQRVILNRFLEQ